MNGRLWGGRRAEAFQHALDGHVDLAEHELSEFVHLAHALSEMPAATLDADTRSSMRARLVAEADAVLTAPPASTRPEAPAPRRRRKLRVAAGSAAAVTALSAGLVTVSANALPGDPLYSVKLGVERFELTFDNSPAATGHTQLDHATTRLDEAEALAANGQLAAVPEVLADFESNAESGANQLLRAYAANGDSSSITDIRSFTNASAERLTALGPTLSESIVPAYEDAVATLEKIDERAIEACPTCAGGPSIQPPETVDPGGNIETLPDKDHDADKGESKQDDILSDKQHMPHNSTLPPEDYGPYGDQDSDGSNDSGNGVIKPGNGSDSDSSGMNEPDNDEGALLPDLPGLTEDHGSADGQTKPLDKQLEQTLDKLNKGLTLSPQEKKQLKNALRPLDDTLDSTLKPLDGALAPLQNLIGPLGPLGDLVGPLLDPTDEDDPSGQNNNNQGILGNLLDRSSNDGSANKDRGQTQDRNQPGQDQQNPRGQNQQDQPGQNQQDQGSLDGEQTKPSEENESSPDEGLVGPLTGKDGESTEEDGSGLLGDNNSLG